MGLFDRFPYTNFHELNLDWIISRIRHIDVTKEETEALRNQTQQLKADTQNIKDNAVSETTALKNQAAASATAAAGSATAAAGSATAAAVSASGIEAARQQIYTNTERIDNILVQGTPTEGNAELIDIRVGANGATYPTAGDAVRGQYSILNQDIKELPHVTEPWNLVKSATGIEILENKAIQNNTTAPYVDNPNYFVVKNIPVDPNAPSYGYVNFSFQSDDGTGCRQVRKDSNKEILSISTNDTLTGITLPSDVFYVDLTFKYKNSATKEKGSYFATQTRPEDRKNYVDFMGGIINTDDIPGVVKENQGVSNYRKGFIVDAEGNVKLKNVLFPEPIWNLAQTANGIEILENKAIQNNTTAPYVDNPNYFVVKNIPVDPNAPSYGYVNFSFQSDDGTGCRQVRKDSNKEILSISTNDTLTGIALPSDVFYVDLAFKYKTPSTKEKGNYFATQSKPEDRYSVINTYGAYIEQSGILGLPEKLSDLSATETLAVNTFGDIFPEELKEQFYNGDKDMIIACIGDSITAAIDFCDSPDEPEHSSPYGIKRCWTEMIAERIRKIQPFYNRLDSQRNGTDFFTKTGTWEWQSTNLDPYEKCIIAHTYASSDLNAAVSFEIDLDTYEKCNIFWNMAPLAGEAMLTVAQGNGKLLASLDRETWVEANGFIHDQRNAYNREGKSAAWLAENGIATHQRQRRLYLKKVAGVTGTVSVTYKRDPSDTDSNSWLYCWGTEMYSGNAVFFDNIGRGGYDISELMEKTSDIFDRKPDAVLYEMPLANDEAKALSVTLNNYQKFFDGNDPCTFKTQSGNYTNVHTIVFMPHLRGTAFDQNDNVIFDSTVQHAGDPIAYVYYRKVYRLVQEILSDYTTAKVINLQERMLNEAKGCNMSWYEAFHGDLGALPEAFVYDTIHLNQRGANKFVKYLLPIYQY